MRCPRCDGEMLLTLGWGSSSVDVMAWCPRCGYAKLGREASVTVHSLEAGDEGG